MSVSSSVFRGLEFGTWPPGLSLLALGPQPWPPVPGPLALACWLWPLDPGLCLQALASASGPCPQPLDPGLSLKGLALGPCPPGWRQDVRTNVRTGRRRDGQMDGQMDGQTKYPLRSIGHCPSEAAAQKGKIKKKKKEKFN